MWMPDLRHDDYAAFRRQFERDAIWARMVAAGDRLPALPLIEVDLGPIHLDRMRQTRFCRCQRSLSSTGAVS
jgi:hypothetical protein